jgi:glycosyltransferase involved in cell wall biosynthesis
MSLASGTHSLAGKLPRSSMRLLRDRRVAVVVPAFNEALLIARTLRSVPAYVDEIVVVDDASHDGTAEAALAVDDARVRVVRKPKNGGVGAAIVTGYREAFAGGADVCAVMAGDAQMDPKDLHALLTPVVLGHADYAKGNRLSYPDVRRHMPITRWLGNTALSGLTRLVTGLPVRDSQCGYSALSRRAAEQLPLDSLWPRYGYPNDLLGLLSERQMIVREVLVRPVYADEQSGVGLRHALLVVPYVLLRVLMRRVRHAVGLGRKAPVPMEEGQGEGLSLASELWRP